MLQGFAERKALLLLEVIQRCRDRHTDFVRQLKARASPSHLFHNPITSTIPM